MYSVSACVTWVLLSLCFSKQARSENGVLTVADYERAGQLHFDAFSYNDEDAQ